ncbi:MAG: OsmC family peroxiredoxin, partial [Nitrospirota bacterium]
MNRDELRAAQEPLKQRYRQQPEAALVTLEAEGEMGEGVTCAGVTMNAVATSIGVEIKRGVVHAEGDLDFRGTLAVAKDAPVGFRAIRLSFD